MTTFSNIIRPGQLNGTGSLTASHVEEIWGAVEGTIERMSVLAPRVRVKPLKGTSVATNFAVGKAVMGRITAGTDVVATSQSKFGKAQMTVDTVVYARTNFPLLETLQTSYDSRTEVGNEHGKEIAKHFDQTFMIQATKAGLLTANRFGLTAAGHSGATQVTLAGASDHLDPALLYAKLIDLITGMRLKDVDPVSDGCILLVNHTDFATLAQAELLINSEYLTSEGTKIPTMKLKAWGVDVIPSNNFVGGQNITGHLLSNADNGNAYDGDFTKVVATMFAPKALMAAETIPLTQQLIWDPIDLNWVLTHYRSYGVSPSIAAFAGCLLKP
jgi:hypothetical protein